MVGVTSGCWNWTGAKVDGYEYFKLGGKMVKTEQAIHAVLTLLAKLQAEQRGIEYRFKEEIGLIDNKVHAAETVLQLFALKEEDDNTAMVEADPEDVAFQGDFRDAPDHDNSGVDTGGLADRSGLRPQGFQADVEGGEAVTV